MPMIFNADPFVSWQDGWGAPAEVLTRKPAYRFVADGVAIQPVTPQQLSRFDGDRLMLQLQCCRPVRFNVLVAGEDCWPADLVAFSVRDGSISLSHFYSFRTKHERLPTAQTVAYVLYESVETVLTRNREVLHCYVPLTLTAPTFTRIHLDDREECELCSPELDQRPAEGGIEVFLKRPN